LAADGQSPEATAPTTAVTVDEAIALALRNNPRLAAALGDLSAARAGVRSAAALTNPSLTFTPALTPGGADEELLFQQPLELNGTRSARTGVARAQLRRTDALAVTELRALVFDTRTAYVELSRAQDLLGIARQVLTTAEELHHGVLRQAEEGLRPGIDQTQTAIEVTRARQQFTLAERQVAVARAALNTLLARPPSEPIVAISLTPAVNAPRPEPQPPDREALLAQALEARAEIQGEEAEQEQFRQEARLARAQGRPDLAPQLRGGGLTRGVTDTGIGLGITLPFIDYGSRRNRIRQAEEAARAQAARVVVARNQVRQEVEQAVARLVAEEAVVRDYETGVLTQARQLLQASRRALQLGAPGASILSALEAQRTYRGVLTEYTNALASVALSRAELERATGSVPAQILAQAAVTTRTETGRPQ